MLNNLTKQEVIEALITLRDDLLRENAKKNISLKEHWFLPDCLEYAINFMEKRKDE